MNKRLFRWLGMLASLAVLTITACNGGASAPAQPTAAPTVPLVSAPHTLYDASTKPASTEPVKEITLTVEQKTLEIAPGVPYEAWTFNGTAPGPILRVRQGDQVKFTLVNNGSMEHSIDFHAAQTPWNVNYQAVKPGDKFSFTWTANYPGVFLYHCGTPPVIAHIANGMYGAIIVDPTEGLPPAREYALVQGEFYAKLGNDGIYHYDGTKAMAVQPDYTVFNGYATQYKDSPLTADPGQLIRIWLVNAGPSEFSSFHVIGAIFDKAYPDGNPKNVEYGRQSVVVPPGGGYMVELTVPDTGVYPFVTHSFADASRGALGMLQVGDAKVEPGMSH
ncbi:MAG: multicopper oxidase domain-containing protein [Chloroflexi bacterium]|nr:multicopper oxidase domain-containing protein [Chloroflexota bacterium]